MNQHNSRAATGSIGGQYRWVWALAVVFLGVGLAGLWYWNERPANVQAAIANVRETANRHDVMTVEALSESDKSVVGRNVSIVNARVSAVTSEQTFWIVGDDEDSPLLVVIDAKAVDKAIKLAQGDRVSASGVVRDGRSRDPLASEDRAQVAKAQVYLAASGVHTVRDGR